MSKRIPTQRKRAAFSVLFDFNSSAVTVDKPNLSSNLTIEPAFDITTLSSGRTIPDDVDWLIWPKRVKLKVIDWTPAIMDLLPLQYATM